MDTNHHHKQNNLDSNNITTNLTSADSNSTDSIKHQYADKMTIIIIPNNSLYEFNSAKSQSANLEKYNLFSYVAHLY